MSKQDVLDRREQRLDQAYWNYIGYMDETRYEGVSEREIEEQYVRLDRIATLLARAADAAFAHRFPSGGPGAPGGAVPLCGTTYDVAECACGCTGYDERCNTWLEGNGHVPSWHVCCGVRS